MAMNIFDFTQRINSFLNFIDIFPLKPQSRTTTQVNVVQCLICDYVIGRFGPPRCFVMKYFEEDTGFGGHTHSIMV